MSTASSASSEMSYTTKGNPETGLNEVVNGSQAENQHNYESQIALLERRKRAEQKDEEYSGRDEANIGLDLEN